MKTIAFLIEAIGWLRIVASPLLTGLIIGFIVYLYKPDRMGLVLAISIAVLGLIIGIVWATRIWKGKGTMHYLSSMAATPELDKKKEENKMQK